MTNIVDKLTNQYLKGELSRQEYESCQRRAIQANRIIDSIHRQMQKPRYKPQTAEELRGQADYPQNIATSAKVMDSDVKEDFR